MRVCNVCLKHDPAYGGLHRSVVDFSRALSGSILSFDDGHGERISVEDGTSVRRIGCGPGWLARDCRVMSAAVTCQADAAVAAADLLVVHSLFRAHAPWAERWARQPGRRYWAVPHGCLDPWGLSQRGLLKRFWLETRGRSYLAHADRIIVSSQRSLEKSQASISSAWISSGILADRAVVVHWPVPLPSLDDRAAARARFRLRHGIPEASRILLFVGRLHAVKRPIETLRAFCAAAQENCHLVMVGMDGDLTHAVVRAAIPAGWQERVHLVGQLAGDDVTEAMFASDGFISLSFQENFGYAAAEAVAAGLPVILSPGHDLAYEMPMREGRFACGWLLGDDSHATAVAAIREWATGSDTTLAAMGGTGRAWAGDILSFERFRDTLTGLLG
jgi:glycosyltransferase involved in cell wall biosynthesis